jgi:rod shape determining protein RodA
VLLSVGMLYIVGLLCIYATEVNRRAVPINTMKQVITLLVSCGVVVVVLRLGFQWFARHALLIVVLAVAALVPLVLARWIPFGVLIPNRRGSYRWIQLPLFQLQPSEFMKVAYIIGLAAYLRYRKNYRTFRGLLIPVLGSMLPMLLILLEPDLGTVILMMPVLFVMLYAAGAKTGHLMALLLIAAAAAPLGWLNLHDYQRARFLGVVLQSETLREKIVEHPEAFWFLATKRQARQWEVDSGMQLLRSKAALGSGALTGEGWGNGTYVEYNFLPDRHNDFVFAIVGHQWGLVGCLFVLICYTLIVVAGMEIAAGTVDPFARLLSVGVIALISAQVLINVGMTLGLMPITGMTLPFVSYGGSSLLANMIGVALLVSVAQRRPFLLSTPPFEFAPPPEESAHIKPIPAYRVHQ